MLFAASEKGQGALGLLVVLAVAAMIIMVAWNQVGPDRHEQIKAQLGL